jgi:hypothetical protein
VRWERPDALSPGKHTLEFDFKYDGLGLGTEKSSRNFWSAPTAYERWSNSANSVLEVLKPHDIASYSKARMPKNTGRLSAIRRNEGERAVSIICRKRRRSLDRRRESEGTA